jgi:acetylornithine deacetylase/succinyl-diaminopimelate desuccinylase-like protein
MDILSEVRDICSRESFQRPLIDLLCRISEVDTSPAQDLADLREGERQVFDILRVAMAELKLPGGSIEWKEISPGIQEHPAFSKPYYATGSAEDVYRGRGNLLYLLDREPFAGGCGVALNAHIDTVAPFFSPSLADDVLSGRGVADDKGNAVVILGVLQVLAELEKRGLVALKNKVTAMFVIDEETGGNGSLDLALDRMLRERYDSILVLECTGNRLHPANRGAVFIRCDGRLAEDDPRGEPAPSLPEAYAFAILELLDEGEAIRQESDHPLFPHRPVQTCTGILGPFGVHPSAICAEVSFLVSGLEPASYETVRECLERGIRGYIARYGDKTQVLDPATGKKKVQRHYDLEWQQDGRCTIWVYGAGGHMGSLPQNDAAIAKWAYMVRELVEQRRSAGAAFSLGFPSLDSPSDLVFEGAQGFLPTHSMEEVKTRTRAAFLRGLGAYLAGEGLRPGAIACDVTFDKLHNEAYACDPGSPTMQRALRTAVELGLMDAGGVMRGWEVSCDARLFAGEYPDLPVLTLGAGNLEHAHSERERVCLPDLFRTVCFASLYVLSESGTIG